MAQFKTCDLCGANLDFGEICDCQSNEVRCKSCGTVTEMQSEIAITDYQCPDCWHRHRAGKEAKTNDKS